MPGVVIGWYATKTPIPWAYATEMKNYLFARAHPEDGGWGWDCCCGGGGG